MYEQRLDRPFHGGFSWTESGDQGSKSADARRVGAAEGFGPRPLPVVQNPSETSGNQRYLAGSGTADHLATTRAKPCKQATLHGHRQTYRGRPPTTENRGVPGSNPGLAIGVLPAIGRVELGGWVFGGGLDHVVQLVVQTLRLRRVGALFGWG